MSNGSWLVKVFTLGLVSSGVLRQVLCRLYNCPSDETKPRSLMCIRMQKSHRHFLFYFIFFSFNAPLVHVRVRWKDQITQHTLKVSVFVIETWWPRPLDTPSGVPFKRGTEYVIYTHPFHSPPTLHFPSYAILGNQSFVGRENKINNGNCFSRFRWCCLRVSVFWTGPLLSTLARLGQTSNQLVYPC